jgi:hypothetical protein
MSSKQSISIEVMCNEDGMLFSPLQICNRLLCEIGMYTFDDVYIWLVPFAKECCDEPLTQPIQVIKNWVVSSTINGKNVYFTEYDLDTPTILSYFHSESNGHIFNSLDDAEVVCKVLNIATVNFVWTVKCI